MACWSLSWGQARLETGGLLWDWWPFCSPVDSVQEWSHEARTCWGAFSMPFLERLKPQRGPVLSSVPHEEILEPGCEHTSCPRGERKCSYSSLKLAKCPQGRVGSLQRPFQVMSPVRWWNPQGGHPPSALSAVVSCAESPCLRNLATSLKIR